MSDLLEPGRIFGERYRIERFLAEGGFGAVYVAEQTATELRVALKVLWPQILGSDDAVEKFKLEARVAGRVNSDHIVRVIDAGFDQPTRMPFLVMELLEGQDLYAVVERSGALPPALVVRYLRQVGSALDKAHGFRDREGRPAPIVHRDLKPENLFLTQREDGSPHVKVLDFGIAKVLSAKTKVTKEVKGTPLFMAFEQASGDPISPQTDIWALGLIAFFLLTGKNYWRAAETPEGSMTQLFAEVLSLPLAPPSRRIAEHGQAIALSPAFDAWFARCVDRDPGKRFATAGEAAAELGAALGAADVPLSRSASAIAFGATIAGPSSGPVSDAAIAPPGSGPTLLAGAVTGSVEMGSSGPLGAVAAKTGASQVAMGATQQSPTGGGLEASDASLLGSRSLVGLGASQPLTEASGSKRPFSLARIGGGVALVALLAGGAALLLRGPRAAGAIAPEPSAAVTEAPNREAKASAAPAVDMGPSATAETSARAAPLASASAPLIPPPSTTPAQARGARAVPPPAPQPTPPPTPPPTKSTDLYHER